MAEIFAAPARYVQGPGVAATLGNEMTLLGLGGPVLVLAGASAVRQLGAIWEQSLETAGFAPAIHPFGGECSRREIAAVADVARRLSARTIVGAGGGKARRKRGLSAASGGTEARTRTVTQPPTRRPRALRRGSSARRRASTPARGNRSCETRGR